MKLRFLDEDHLVSAIRKDFFVPRARLAKGIGDDGAVIRAGGRLYILTKDLLIENVHFKRSFQRPFLLGRKSLAVNLSDIAAMGGNPKYALLGLGLPKNTEKQWVEDFFSGFKSQAEEWNVDLIGGDLSESKDVFVSVTVLGESEHIIGRDGGKPGHLIFVSGWLGEAGQGLRLLRKGVRLGNKRDFDRMLKAFLDPVPQVSLAKILSKNRLASSMIDISDGLSIDLKRLCRESDVGAEILREDIPVSPELRRVSRRPYELALQGGEDYQLLFSVPKDRRSDVERFKRKNKLTCIGVLTSEKTLVIIDEHGRRSPLNVKGYKHFL